MNQDNRRFGAFSSSNNPEELSVAFQAILKVVGGVLVFYGLLSAEEYTTLLNSLNQALVQIATLIPLAYAMWHTGEVIFGVLRKVAVKMFARW